MQGPRINNLIQNYKVNTFMINSEMCKINIEHNIFNMFSTSERCFHRNETERNKQFFINH